MTQKNIDASPDSPPPAAERSLWRHGPFMRLWTAETISQFGSAITLLALPLTAVTLLGATPLEMGILTALETAAFLVIALPAGVIIDRHRRRPFLIWGDVVRGVALVSIPIAFIAGSLTMYQLYAVAAITGVGTVFFDVAYQAYLPSLIDRSKLVEGNSKLELSRSAAALAGPGIAGVLIEILRAPVTIFLDAMSFFLSALFVGFIREPEPVPVSKEKRGSMRSEIVEGLRLISGNPVLRGLAGSTGTSNFSSSAIYALLVLYASKELDMSAGTLGLVFALQNIGFLVGALTAGRIASGIGVGKTIIGSILLGSLAMLPIAFLNRDTAFAGLLAAGMVFSFSSPVYNITQVSLRQAITPIRLQGRMNASMRFIIWGTMPLGALAGGFLGNSLGVRPAIFAGAVVGLGAFLWVLLSPVRRIETQPEPVGSPDPTR